MASFDGQIITLAPDRLFALCHPYSVEGRVSTHPSGAQGYTCMNCYVLLENEEALLIDTGMSVHQHAIIAQLETLLGELRSLSILPFRFGEFNAISNSRPIADRFPLRAIYGNMLGQPSEWLDFRPGFPPGGGLLGVASPPVWTDGHISVDVANLRRLFIIKPPIRLLPGLWAYDEQTRTLFTSDIFTWLWRSNPHGPWLAQPNDVPTPASDVQDFLIHNRYWWLAGARTGRLRQDLAKIFHEHEVERIAPGYGCIIEGTEAVAHQYRLLHDVLMRLEQQPATGVTAGSLSFRSAK